MANLFPFLTPADKVQWHELLNRLELDSKKHGSGHLSPVQRQLPVRLNSG
jgi:hypothetical protein